MRNERMEFLVNEVNQLTKKKEEMKLKNIPLWNWPNEEGELIEMYVDEIAKLKQNNEEEIKMMDTHKEAELVEIFIERLNKREKEREEEMMKRRLDGQDNHKQTKEEQTMTNTERVPSETELLSQLMGNLNNKNSKEETKMSKDNNKELLAAKGLAIGVNQLSTSNLLGEVESKALSATVQEVASALVAIEKAEKYPVNLKERVTNKLGNETYKAIIKRGGNREVFNKVWKTITTIANQYYINNKEEEKMIKMDLQFFASKEEEESTMWEQIEMFNDIAKQIEELDKAGGDVYVGGVKVSWESVKQFIYGLDDEELKLLAYSNKPEIPAELEVFSLYLLEAEKAWDNELTLQNAYFNSKENISMDLQFFAKGVSKEKRTLEGHTLALSHIENLEEQKESLLSFLDGRKVDELTNYIQEELSNIESSIKRWSSVHNESLRSRAKEGAIKLGRGY